MLQTEPDLPPLHLPRSRFQQKSGKAPRGYRICQHPLIDCVCHDHDRWLFVLMRMWTMRKGLMFIPLALHPLVLAILTGTRSNSSNLSTPHAPWCTRSSHDASFSLSIMNVSNRYRYRNPFQHRQILPSLFRSPCGEPSGDWISGGSVCRETR